MLSPGSRVQRTIAFEQAYYILILAETFITARKAEGLSKGTLKYYREKLTIFLAWCEAQAVTQLQDLTPDLLRRFINTLSETHNPGGVHGIYRAVRALLLFIEAEEVLPEWRSPTRKVKAPKVELDPIEGASLEDIKAMLAACDKGFTGVRDTAVMLVLLDTGARATEFISVDVSDVDAAGTITLRHTKGKVSRQVYLTQKTRKALRRYLRMRHDHGRALWLSVNGDRLSYDALRGIFHRRALLAGLQNVPSPHDFRRCMALTFLRNGGDIFTLARLLGHKTIHVLKRYLAQTDQDAQIAHAKYSAVDSL